MADKLRVLVVGAGSIGVRHVRCFLNTGRAQVALCEINDKLRDEVAAGYNLAGSFGDFSQALQAGTDAVVICTPAHLHVPMAIEAATAGFNLLIEKPLSTSFEGIERLKHIVAEKNLVCGVAYVSRSHPVLSSMRDAVRTGRFGRPLQAVINSGQHFPHYRPAYRDIYYNNRATGGGAIQDAITHLVNAVEWIVGPVTDLVADCEHLALEGVDVEDAVHLMARHGTVLASYNLNQFQAPNETTIQIVCEQGTVRFEAHNNRWQWAVAPEEPWHVEQFPAMERDALFVAQANAFLDAVANQSSPLCSLAEGEQTLRVNLAALESATTRSWRSIDI